MRPQRRHGAMLAPAAGPLAIKIVRMVGGTAHLAASPSLTLSAVPEGTVISAGGRLSAQFNFAACAGDVTAQLLVHPTRLGRYGVPAPMTVCQKSAPRKATTIIRRIRPRVSRSNVLVISRSGSLMRN